MWVALVNSIDRDDMMGCDGEDERHVTLNLCPPSLELCSSTVTLITHASAWLVSREARYSWDSWGGGGGGGASPVKRGGEASGGSSVTWAPRA